LASAHLRHPHKIIGDNVVIDDLCCLDAKGTDNRGITIGNGVFVGRNTILSCKNGDIVSRTGRIWASTARSSRPRPCASAPMS
jgi:acetyltransferase-like isoleucine patch superfamily enzyme